MFNLVRITICIFVMYVALFTPIGGTIMLGFGLTLCVAAALLAAE